MTLVHQWAVGYGIQFGPNVPPHQTGGGKDWAQVRSLPGCRG
jgi:hypothetical protein